MAGLTYDGIPSTQTDSSNFSGINIYASNISGIAIRVTTATFVNATNGDGQLQSVSAGSPSTFGGWTYVGSATTGAGSLGTYVGGEDLPSTNYYVLFSPRNFAAGVGSVVPYASGTKSTVGGSFVGAASASYDYIIIGTGQGA